MNIAPAGSAGVVSVGAAGAAVTPAWGTGSNRTAGNLLVCWVTGVQHSYVPATPAGWSVAAQLGEGSPAWASATIFTKTATGADAAPTIAAQSGIIWGAQLAELSGAGGLDRSGTGFSATSPNAVAANAADAAVGDLVLYAEAISCTTAQMLTRTSALNNGATDTNTNNDSTSTIAHYSFGWGITTGNSAADAHTSTWGSGAAGSTKVVASFAPAAVPAGAVAVMQWNGTAYVPASGVVTIWCGPNQPATMATGDIWQRTNS